MIKQNQRILNDPSAQRCITDGSGVFCDHRNPLWYDGRHLDHQSAKYGIYLALYCGAELILFYMLRVYVLQHHDHRCGAPPENRAPGTGPLELHNQHYVVEIKNGRPVAARKVRKNKTLLPAFSK